MGRMILSGLSSAIGVSGVAMLLIAVFMMGDNAALAQTGGGCVQNCSTMLCPLSSQCGQELSCGNLDMKPCPIGCICRLDKINDTCICPDP